MIVNFISEAAATFILIRDTIAYCVEYDGKVFRYCTDVELRNHVNDNGSFNPKFPRASAWKRFDKMVTAV